MTQQLPNGKQQFVDINGKPLVGGLVYHYLVSTSTPKNTYQDSAQTILNTNPVVLDSRGQASIYGTGNYRQVVQDSTFVQIWDQVVLDASGQFIADLGNTADPTKGVALIPTASRVVSNISTLRTLPKTGGSVAAFVQGYYTAADGGGGQYYLDAADTTTADNGGSVIVAADGGRWKLDSTTSWSVKQFGAKGDNATDDYASIAAAIVAASGELLLPAGNYRISAGLLWTKSGLTLVGAGAGATTLTATFAAGDVICVGDGAANPNFSGVRDLTISNSVTRTAGAGIRFRNGHNLQARNFRTFGQPNGVQLDGGAQQFLYTLDNFEISNGVTGIFIGPSGGGLPQDVWIGSGIIAGCTGSGINLKNVSGLYMRQIDLLNCLNGISSFPSVGDVCTAVWGYDIIADTCTGIGWNIITNGGIVSTWMLTDCWASNCGGTTLANNGMTFDGTGGNMRNINLVSPQVNLSGGHGIACKAVEALSILNPKVFSNSLAGLGLADGIIINASMAGWNIIGGKVGTGAPYTLVNNQRYGINIGASCDNFVVSGVNVIANNTAGIFNGASPADGVIIACPAYVTKNSGVAVINVATNAIVVNHGLGATPQAQDITLTAVSSTTASSVASWYVTGITATQFTITTNANVAGTAFSVGWQARLRGV